MLWRLGVLTIGGAALPTHGTSHQCDDSPDPRWSWDDLKSTLASDVMVFSGEGGALLSEVLMVWTSVWRRARERFIWEGEIQ